MCGVRRVTHASSGRRRLETRFGVSRGRPRLLQRQLQGFFLSFPFPHTNSVTIHHTRAGRCEAWIRRRGGTEFLVQGALPPGEKVLKRDLIINTPRTSKTSQHASITFEFRHGEGHLIYTSGDEYKGHFHGGMYGGGEGELICGDYHYVGEWKEGKRCGKGRCVLTSCDL